MNVGDVRRQLWEGSRWVTIVWREADLERRVAELERVVTLLSKGEPITPWQPADTDLERVQQVKRAREAERVPCAWCGEPIFYSAEDVVMLHDRMTHYMETGDNAYYCLDGSGHTADQVRTKGKGSAPSVEAQLHAQMILAAHAMRLLEAWQNPIVSTRKGPP